MAEQQKPIRNIPFSPPDMSEAEVAEVAAALRSGWITTGPRVKELEKKVAAWVGVGCTEGGTPRCVCLNSQTACQEMSLHLMGIGSISGGSAEDEVIVPAYTYTASASVVCHVGAKPVLVDIQKDQPTIDYDALEAAITEHTKAVIPVDLGGVPCDYDRIFEILERKKALFRPTSNLQKALGRVAVLSDTAHAFGASYRDKMIGNVADFSAFSWHAVKNFTTGEGGCLTWKAHEGFDDEAIYHELQLLSLHGQSKDALNKNKPGMWEYDIVAPYYKCNMTDIMAAIGLAQFPRYNGMLARRKEIISRFDKAFRPLGIQTLDHYTGNYTSSGHLYLTRLFHKDGRPFSDEERREVIVKMALAGIACNVHYKPLPLHTAYKNLGFDAKDYPNAINFYLNEVTLPLHTRLTDEDVDYIIEQYTRIVKEYL
ncbi:MAG: DegT/DnrJ/EryC1/StrS family aminotransferase [Clostridia bacterium]|nr:DegT/DnrJ/EryC1/StrS family aminotransferase [Clostridia bacterium]